MAALDAALKALESQVSGYWGVPSSTLDWCEENYIVTNYIAEFWNTISNLLMIGLGAFGAITTIICTPRDRKILTGHIALFVVGIGSLAFHCGLQWGGQLLDELPMVGASCVFLFLITELDQSIQSSMTISFVLALYTSLVSVVYVSTRLPIIHNLAFAIIVGGIAVRCGIVLKQLRRSAIIKSARVLLFWAVVMFSTAFLLWNIDNQACVWLRQTRDTWAERYGIPGKILSVLLQLHAWWHLLTGSASYAALLAISIPRLNWAHQRPQLRWFLWVFPYVVALNVSGSIRTNNSSSINNNTTEKARSTSPRGQIKKD